MRGREEGHHAHEFLLATRRWRAGAAPSAPTLRAGGGTPREKLADTTTCPANSTITFNLPGSVPWTITLVERLVRPRLLACLAKLLRRGYAALTRAS